MMDGLKQRVKDGLTAWQRWKYDRMLEKKTVTYDGWIRRVEAEKFGEEAETGRLSVRQVPYEVFWDYLNGEMMGAEKADVALFVGKDGTVSEIAERVTADYFERNRDTDIAYGDEDVLGPDGIRYTPWFKPDWSPDTFLSYFYFGNIFAVRMRALRELTKAEKDWIGQEEGKGGSGHAAMYRLCYVLAVKCGGFTVRDSCAEEGDGFGFPVGHMDEVLFHARSNREMELLCSRPLERSGCPAGERNGRESRREEILSIVIPSKDNIEVLKRCIGAVQRLVREAEQVSACEVIVVDNGSADWVRKELEDWMERQEKADGKKIRYFYHYEKMPFHFSGMCNKGAAAASGDVLLFLNDDVEMTADGAKEQENLLDRLYGRAKRRYTGAVGVKLYYPDSRRIQHAGIVNLRPGPVHKLQFKEDDADYYYGWNRRERNVTAVTGACLAVERKKYAEAGGFPEELPVAFNDVDFCFTLFEKGYYNVVLQDAALYHYESMSRGKDDGREKLERLLGEKDKLYERHPRMYGADPFYHKYLAGDMLSTGFELRADYDWNPQIRSGKPEEERLDVKCREDACVMVSLEYAGTVGKFLTVRKQGNGLTEAEERTGGKDRMYLIQGYAFVTGSDNACYEKRLIFGREPETCTKQAGASEQAVQTGSRTCGVWSVAVDSLPRKDVEENLPDQVNVGLTGFSVLVGNRDLPSGAYRIGVLVRDKCSGQRLYSWTNRYLTV